MRHGVQYGELVHDAARHILTASLELESTAFVDAAAGNEAVLAYRDLLHALGRHGQQLFGTDAPVRRIRATVNPDPCEIAAASLVEHLVEAGKRDASDPAVGWRAAAGAVRTASDLLATHRDREGSLRSPQGAVLDDLAVKVAGFGELASLTLPVAAAANSLGRRLVEVGVDAAEVDEFVPEVQPIQDAARDTRRLANRVGLAAPLSSLEVARPRVRTGEPVVELGDRLARLHLAAWQLTRENWVGAMTLADFAAAGVMVSEYATRVLRRVASIGPADTPDLSVRRALTRFEGAGASWRLVHLNVRKLRTTTPASPAVREDVVAVRRLLEEVVASEVPGRDVQAVVLGGARAFGDVAGWNREALQRQWELGRLLVPGRFLTGNQVSDDPAMVTLKLKGRMAPALTDHVDPLRTAYEAARGAASLQYSGAAFAQAHPGNPRHDRPLGLP